MLIDFSTHLKERLQSMFAPDMLDWGSINFENSFENSLAAPKNYNSGNVMKVIKTWLNAWTTSSRMCGAHYIYPCLLGCSDSCDRLRHYLICLLLFSLCKYMHRDFSIHPTDRWGLNSPDKGIIIHMCCVFPGYHGVVSHAKLNHLRPCRGSTGGKIIDWK